MSGITEWFQNFLSPAPSTGYGGGMRTGYTGSTAAQRQGRGPVDTALTGIAQYGEGIPSVASATPGSSFMDGLTGWKGADGVQHNGWGDIALGGAQGLMGLYQGMQQYGLARDQFEQSKDQYNQDYAAQRTSYNNDLEDRQRARVASNSGGYQSVDDYMAKHRVA